MQVIPIRDVRQWDEVAQVWDCLAWGNPFRGRAWLRSWWNAYSSDHELFILQVNNHEGDIIGFAPWFIERSLSQGQVVRFLGSGEVCSDYLGILATPEYVNQVAEALAHWLTYHEGNGQGPPCHWDLLDLSGVDAADHGIQRLAEQLTNAGNHVHSRRDNSCWRIELPDSWDEYLQRLSKSHRKQVRRIERRYLDNGMAQLHTARTQSELEEAMPILVDLHQQRRVSLNEPGCFASASFNSFLHEAVEQLSESEAAELHWIELAGRAVAAELHLIGGCVTYAYQAGVLPDALDQEPGRIMNVAVLKHNIDEGQEVFDFLRGDEPYKAHWRATPRPSLCCRVVPRRAAAQLRHQMWQAGDTMKHWIKAGLSLTGVL
jgi:CelD/BcsL family acetyltransferase involved in cellulose biosynthesis